MGTGQFGLRAGGLGVADYQHLEERVQCWCLVEALGIWTVREKFRPSTGGWDLEGYHLFGWREDPDAVG